MTVAQQISAIRKSAERMDAAATETIGTASLGDVIRQGDLYLICLDSLPAGNRAKSTQLAPGTTQGSRHVATGECVVYEPTDKATVARRIKDANGADVPVELIGPVIQAIGQCEIDHPEHGNKVLPVGSIWAVTYQRAYADEVRRVQD
jgi:hypothetical protein